MFGLKFYNRLAKRGVWKIIDSDECGMNGRCCLGRVYSKHLLNYVPAKREIQNCECFWKEEDANIYCKELNRLRAEENLAKASTHSLLDKETSIRVKSGNSVMIYDCSSGKRILLSNAFIPNIAKIYHNSGTGTTTVVLDLGERATVRLSKADKSEDSVYSAVAYALSKLRFGSNSAFKRAVNGALVEVPKGGSNDDVNI